LGEGEGGGGIAEGAGKPVFNGFSPMFWAQTKAKLGKGRLVGSMGRMPRTKEGPLPTQGRGGKIILRKKKKRWCHGGVWSAISNILQGGTGNEALGKGKKKDSRHLLCALMCQRGTKRGGGSGKINKREKEFAPEKGKLAVGVTKTLLSLSVECTGGGEVIDRTSP